ncbi:hypothetical protein QF002_007378 [Paraburkholderia youngii]
MIQRHWIDAESSVASLCIGGGKSVALAPT